MGCLKVVVVGLIASAFAIFVSARDDDDGYTLKLEHSFGNGEFHERGELYFPSIRGEQALVQKQAPLSKKEYLLMEKLSKNGGIYRVRVKSKLSALSSNADSDESTWIMSYTYAKHLMDANLADEIVLHTDGLGNLMAINLSPSLYGQYMDFNAFEFTTNVTVVVPGAAAVPDTMGFLNKLEDERRKKEAAAKEPSSFFSKYWMYIVPVVLVMMLQSAAQQQPQ